MKKVLPIMLCLAVMLGVFTACSKANEEETTTEPTSAQTTVENPTDAAVIKEADAVNLVKSYSDEELGLSTEEREACSFMVASTGKEVDGEVYINVIAAIKIKNEPNEQGVVTYNFDTRGSYYISFDGQKIMREDGDGYVEMPMHEVPSNSGQ